MLLRAKLKATGIHLGISFLIFIAIVPFIYLQWYPEPYFAQAGGWHGVRILAAVDLVLGPLLTFVIFHPEKPKKLLMMDYGFIASAQIAALLWGVYAIHSQRPVAVVYHSGFFESIQADTLGAQDYDRESLLALSNERPPLIYSRKPANQDELSGVLHWAMLKGISQYQLQFLFEPLIDHMSSIEDRRKSMDEKRQRALQELLESRNLPADEVKVVPFRGRYGSAWLVLDTKGSLVDAL